MRVEVQRLLREDHVKFATEFTSVKNGMREMLVSQLLRYSFVVVEAKESGANPTKRPKVVLSGKSAGQSDDLAIALQMLAFWIPQYWADGKAALVDG